MLLKKYFAAVFIAALLMPMTAFGQATGTAKDAVAKIRDEGMNRSQAMKTMNYLTDVIGARLTNSPSQKRSNVWTKEQFEKWGLQNAAVDPWGEFGRGWELTKFSSTVIAPEYMPFRAFPKAWSPGTNGAVTGDVMLVNATNDEELAKYKGKLKNAIILDSPPRKVSPGFEPVATRHNENNLTEMEKRPLAAAAPQMRRPTEEQIAAAQFQARKFQFIIDEGAAMLIDTDATVNAGTIRVMGARIPQPMTPGSGPSNIRVYSKDAPATVPQMSAEVEQYNRLYRLVQQNVPVKMTVELGVKFYEDDLQGYNTIAEIPGTDLKDEVVMIGAHLDSWHSGTGATDNGAGTTVVMEAMRILQSSGLKPRRTIRVALWTGEEQGLLGSRGYVAKNFAERQGTGPNSTIVRKSAYDKFAAYYNLDNGTGQIRGIYAQGNENARPIFKEWLEPFKDFNAITTTIADTGGTDHLAFDAVGLPGFQFIQDPIEYFPRTWHTTQDVSDRILEEDLKRSAVIMATFAYNSAMTNEKLPRKNDSTAFFSSLFSKGSFFYEMEEIAFMNSGLDFSICGHPVEEDEIPQGFPAVFAVNPNSHHGHSHAE